MRIITRNLKGTLKSGEQYKIAFEDKYDKILKERYVMVFKDVYDEVFKMWISKNAVCKHYSDVRGYKAALKKAILEAEKKWNIQLLKGNLKIVA